MQLNKCKICGADIPYLPRHGLAAYQRKTTCSQKCAGLSSVLKRNNQQPPRKSLSTSWHDGVTIKYLTFSRLIDKRTA